MNVTTPQQWLDIATEDLVVARLTYSQGHTAHTCFLSQQCIEKSLKAFLIGKSNTYPRIHNLIDLLDLCRSLDASFAQFFSACKVVDEYYIPTRYPPGFMGAVAPGAPSPIEAEEAINAADNILQFVTQRLSSP